MRARFPFDNNPVIDVKYLNPLAVSSDRRFYYLSGGANNGLRVLVEHDGNGRWGVADWLHADETIETDLYDGLQRLLSRAANIGIVSLLDIGEIPGFQKPDLFEVGQARHVTGWYTRSRFALEIDPPWWAPDARAFDTREGIYIVFADNEGYRLVPKGEYFQGSLLGTHGNPPDKRQGDLLLWSIEEPYPDAPHPEEKDWVFDRHHVVGEDSQAHNQDDPPCFFLNPHISHPEHGEMKLEGWWTVMLAPGVSRPFSRSVTGLD